jgi:hypothetical protein
MLETSDLSTECYVCFGMIASGDTEERENASVPMKLKIGGDILVVAEH